MPAEWTPHEAVWLAWPHDTTTFPNLDRVEAAYLDMIAAIHESETVHLLVLNEAMKVRVAGRLAARGVNLARVAMHVTDYADVWFRDYGPTFVVNETEKQLAMVHWRFNAWGGKYPELMKDARLPEWMNGWLHLPCFEPAVVMEGGALEVNGAGTLMTTEQCLLHSQRNPHWDRFHIERVLHHYLGTRHVVWLGEGIAGDDTDGHVDDIARFVDPSVIVCAWEEDPWDENFKALEDNWQRLQVARDQDGRPFALVKLPMPGRVEGATGRLPASYANFYIGNTVVLLPVFGHEYDEVARLILQGLFPTRRVVPIEARDLVVGLGPLHCMTQQQPRI